MTPQVSFKRARAPLQCGSQTLSGLAQSLHLPGTIASPAAAGKSSTYSPAGGKGNEGPCDVVAGTGRLRGTSLLEHYCRLFAGQREMTASDVGMGIKNRNDRICINGNLKLENRGHTGGLRS